MTCRLVSHIIDSIPTCTCTHTNWKRSTLYFHMHSLIAPPPLPPPSPSSLSLPPSIQTFFSEGASQRKELAVLRELCEGHFNHDNLCRVLDVSLDRAPVLSWKGALLGAVATSGRDDLGTYIVKEARCFLHLFPLLLSSPHSSPPLTPPLPHRRGSI